MEEWIKLDSEFAEEAGRTLKSLSERSVMAEMLEKQFTKRDLKTGMIVETRDGYKAMVLLGTNNGDIISGEVWFPLECYNEDLTSNVLKTRDIMKVYQPKTNKQYLNKDAWDDTVGLFVSDDILIWDREHKKQEEENKTERTNKAISEIKEVLSKYSDLSIKINIEVK